MVAVENHREPAHAGWQNYANLLSAAHRAFSVEIDACIREMPLARIHRVLDVPSGDGFYAEILARRLPHGGMVIAADLDEGPLATLNRRTERLGEKSTFVAHMADIYALPYEDHSFDMVWCAQSLISLSEPDEGQLGAGITKAFQELHRVLRPGGRIVLLEQDAMHHVVLPWPVDLELTLRIAERKGFARLYGRSQQMNFGRHLAQLLGKMGFQVHKKMTLTADRQGIPTGDLHQFLKAYFAELSRRVETDLSEDEMRRFKSLIDPASDNSFFNSPDFEMTWLEFLAIGTKPGT